MVISTFTQRIGRRFWFAVLLVGAVIGLLAACQATQSAPTQAELECACSDESSLPNGSIDAQLRTVIAQRGLTGDPSVGRAIPSIDAPLAQLGLKLFFTKELGGDADSACASCHLPTMGGGDGLSLPIGVGALDPDLVGPGRLHPSGGPTVPRNSPTTFNIALWDSVMFHDGRVESLGKTPGANGEDGLGIRTPDSAFGVADPLAGQNLPMAQARFPVTSKEEMRGFHLDTATNQDLRDFLATRLDEAYLTLGNANGISPWNAEFEAVFGPSTTEQPLITEQRIAEAIAAYERSQLFVNTSWQTYVQGDDAAISAQAKKGALLFLQSVEEGGANCASCHVGDFFTDEQFHVLAVPQLGPGKGDGATGMHDYGRFRETQNPDDMYAFRTPSLLNVAVTAPYGHDGAYRTLERMIRHILNPAAALENYDFQQVDEGVQTEFCVENSQEALAKWQENREAGILTVEPMTLEDGDVEALVAFLQTLTDPCTQDAACLSPWMPNPSRVDFGAFQIVGTPAADE